MKKFFKIITIFLFALISLDLHSQDHELYFSVTGDTICYTGTFGFEIDSLTEGIGHSVYIQTDGKNGTPKTISTFTIICKASNLCLQSLNKDTIKKYNLNTDGNEGAWGPKSDIIVSVKPTNTKLVDTSAFGPKFIYKTTVVAIITCKGQKIYSNTFDVMFKGNSPKDFPERDIVRIKAWRKRNTKKYFVDLSVKEFQIFKKPTDTEDSRFKNFVFIL